MRFKSFLLLYPMQENYFGKTERKSTFLYIAIGLMLLCAGLSINTDLAEFAQHKTLNIPQWFFWIIFAIDALLVAAIIGILFYRKIAVIAVPVLVMAHFILHNYYLSTTLYSDLNFLFVYFAAGLLAVIPRWNYFR